MAGDNNLEQSMSASPKTLTAKLNEREAWLLQKMLSLVKEKYPGTNQTDYIKGLLLLDAYRAGFSVPKLGIQVPAWANAKMYSDSEKRLRPPALKPAEEKKRWAK